MEPQGEHDSCSRVLKKTRKLVERLFSGSTRTPIRRAPSTLVNLGKRRWTSRDGDGTSSGARRFAAESFERKLPYASTNASTSPRYHASSSWHAMRTMLSSRPPSRQRSSNFFFSLTQSPSSLSCTTTNRTPGSLQDRNLIGMLFIRSFLPSCDMQMKFMAGNHLFNKLSRNTSMDFSSSRNTIRLIAALASPASLASKVRPANLRA